MICQLCRRYKPNQFPGGVGCDRCWVYIFGLIDSGGTAYANLLIALAAQYRQERGE